MKNKKTISKVIDVILNILIVIFAIFLLISLYTTIQVKVLGHEYSNFFGYSLFEVETGSMHGTIEAGDWIIVKSDKDVKPDDIITYKQSENFITHRVMEAYGGTYVTKGDANNKADDPIDQSQIVGKVVKTLPGFGILRKTIFNPVVIVLLIICLYLFNLMFKPGKSKFDQKIEDLFNKLLGKPSKENNNELAKKVETSKLFKKDEQKEIAEVVKEAKKDKIIKPKDEFDKFDEFVEEEEEESDNEVDVEEFTQTLNLINLQNNGEEEVIEEEEEDEDTEEELSKTSLYRIISVNTSDVDSVPVKVEKEPKEEKKVKATKAVKATKEKTVTSSKKKNEIVLEAEEVVKKEPTKTINQDYIYNRIKSKKSKNVVEKAFFIKILEYNEILDVLLKPCKVYVYKSKLRAEFMFKYMTYKYYGTEEERKNRKALIKEYADELTKKNVRDEKVTTAIAEYLKAFTFIANTEDKKTIDYKKEIKNIFKDYSDEQIGYMAKDIENISKYTKKYIQELLVKLETNTFEVKYSKFTNQKNLYGTILNHNIAFSKVYSNYIVDKTYSSDDIVTEDKLEVLLNMLLCKVVSDMMKLDYNSRYFVYIPKALYAKNKKLDKIASLIENDYAKSHIYFLTEVSHMLKNKEDFKRLRKKGYSFACIFDEHIDYKHDDLGYIYMNDYFFIDSRQDTKEILKGIPKDITNKLITDNVSKKVGNRGGE